MILYYYHYCFNFVFHTNFSFIQRKCLLHHLCLVTLTFTAGMWKEERRNSVGVVNPLNYVHLHHGLIQEDCTIAVAKDILRFDF